MMKRTVVVIAVLGVAVVAALPPLFGAKARSLVEGEVAAIRETLAPWASVAVTFDDWDVGWLSSTANANAVILDAESAANIDQHPALLDRSFSGTVTLHHGPFLTGFAPGLGWGSVEFIIDSTLIPELQDFHAATGVDRIARLGIRLGFGETTAGIDMPTFAYAPGGQNPWIEVKFEGLDMHATLGEAGERMEFDGEVGGFRIALQSSGEADVGPLRWGVRAQEYPRIEELWLGEAWLDLARLTIADIGGERLAEASDIHLEAGTRIDGNILLFTNLFEIGDATVAQVRLEELVASASTGYDVDALGRLLEVADELEDMSSEAEAELFNALARERFTFDIDRLGFSHEGKALSASLAIEFRGDELPDDFQIDDEIDPATLLPFVSAHLDLAFHKDLTSGLGIDEADAVIGLLALTGILRESGDDRTLSVGFDRGAVSVNGESLEPSVLQEMLGNL